MKRALYAVAAATLMASGPAAAADWTGFYAGLGLGTLDVDTNTGLSNDDTTYGVHAGYRYDLGTWVVGGELEYDDTDVELVPGTVFVDSVFRVKGTAGYDLGQFMPYLALGTAEVSVTGVGDDWGAFYGAGLAYEVAPNAILSAEILEHDFSNINGSGIDADATSFSLRASFGF